MVVRKVFTLNSCGIYGHNYGSYIDRVEALMVWDSEDSSRIFTL